MPGDPGKLSQLWQELRRRKVTRTITVYAAAAFVILELVDIIAPNLGLPEWTFNLVLILLLVGFVIAVIFSWIYDIHPEVGIVKTETAQKVKAEDIPKSSSSWKIASYISFVVIVGLIVLNIIPRSNQTNITEILDKSIAVLPFASLSDDPEKQYLADGVMEDILLQLAKIEDLRVMSSTSVQRYRDTDKTATEICQELGVSYVLEGRFQKYGDQARLIVQLIQTGIEGHAWANDYNREWTDIFSVQSEVAQAIAWELRAVITPEENQLIEKIPTTNMSAYDLYLKGIQEYYDFWETGAIEQVHMSIGSFMKAIELDPEYSLAYTGLGRAYWMLGQFDPNRSPLHWEESRRLLKKAISLDPANGWAYSELGVVLSNWDWDSTATKDAFENALELSPNRSDVYDHYTYHAFRVGNCERLASLLKEIKNRFYPDIDIRNDLRLLICKEEFEEICRITDLEWNRNTGFIETTYIAQAYTIIGDYEKALEMSEYMLESHPIIEYGLTIKGMTLGLMGNKDGARKSFDELKSLSESRIISPTLFAGISLALGDIEKTKDYLEQALKERDLLLHEIDHWASFYAYKNEPWLKEIIDRSWTPLVDSEPETEETY